MAKWSMTEHGQPLLAERASRGRPVGNRAAQFWSKVDIRGQDECWPWEGAVAKSGYGNFWNRNASRVCMEIMGDPCPKGMVVMHSCDNPVCCNPEHLRHGTYSENTLDSYAKGRR